jgi:DNA-binding transcriptional MerR regulator
MTHAARGSLPPKLYYRIGEVAELVGVEPHVLRYWEREFRSIRPTKSAKGQRVYSRRDVENLMRVRELLYSEGFTIAGAKKKLQRGGVDASDAGAEASETPEAREQAEAGAMRSAADAADDEPIEEPIDRDAARTKEQLLAMRSDIEAFLDELGRGPS